MTTAQVVETSVTVNSNSPPVQDYVHPDDQTQPTFEFVVFENFTSADLSQIKREIMWLHVKLMQLVAYTG